MTKSRRWRAVAALFCGFAALVAMHQINAWWTGNFGTVITGVLYRSAQLSPTQLRARVAEHDIRTIINLRGAPPGEAWHDAERATADSLGVKLIDFPMSSRQILTPERAKALLALMRMAERPILIHCRGGADRTGLASVMFVSQIAGVDEEIAEEQLTLRYGHIGIPYLSASYAMDESWEALEVEFGIDGS